MARVYNTMRWIRPYESKNGHQVFIRVRMKSGFEANIPVYDFVKNERIPISVKKEYWNKGFITGGIYHKSVREINSILSKVESFVDDAIRELIEKNIKISKENIYKLAYINELTAEENERKIASGEIIVDEQGGAFASHEEFVEFIEESDDPRFIDLKKAMGLISKEYILDYWDDFIKNYAPDSYNTPRNAITEYQKNTGDYCKASEFSAEWLNRFFHYIVKNGYSFRKDGTNRKQYRVATITKYHKHIRHFGDYLFFEEKILDNQDYIRFKLTNIKSSKKSILHYKSNQFINTHALYKKEFDYFYGVKFQDKKQELAKDMFVLQVWLGGLRQVDFYKLSEENFHRDSNGIKVWFAQKKTDDTVLNTANQNYIEPILLKYQNIFKEFPKVHVYNKLLKKAAEAAGLNRKLMFTHEFANAKKPEREWIEIYKKISNEWARNCAVSILCELGYPDYRIASFTGHKDLEMINHYKAIHKKELQTMMDEVKPEIVTKL